MLAPDEAAETEERGLFRGSLETLTDSVLVAVKEKQKNALSIRRPAAAPLAKMEVDLSMQRLRSIPALTVRDDEVDSLDFNGNFITSIDPAAFSTLHLTRLNLGSNDLVHPPNMAFLSSLRELYLNSNRLTSLAPDFLHLSSLEVLDLRKNRLEKLDLFLFSNSRATLRRLSLSCNRLTELIVPDGVVFDKLTFLGLFGNRLPVGKQLLLDLSRSCPHLQKLILSGNAFTPDAEYRALAIRLWKGLQWLDWQYVLHVSPEEWQGADGQVVGPRKRKAEEGDLEEAAS